MLLYRKPALFLFVVALGLFLARPAAAQSEDFSDDDSAPALASPQPQETSAHLSISANGDTQAVARLTLNGFSSNQSAVRDALAVAIGCPVTAESFGRDEALFTAPCSPHTASHLLQTRGVVALGPLERALGSEGVGRLSVTLRLPQEETVNAEPNPSGMSVTRTEVTFLFTFDHLAPRNDEIRFSYGFSASTLATMAAILAVVLLLPIPFTLWLRHKALHAPEEARTSVLFAYLRYQLWGMTGGLLLWWTAIDLLAADRVTAFFLGGWLHSGIASYYFDWALLWLPPMLIYILCSALGAPIHRLRRNQPQQRTGASQPFWAVVAAFLPLAFMIAGIYCLFHSLRLAVLCLAGWYFGKLFATRKVAQSQGVQANALTHGDLRDRAFALAANARVALQQVYVIPTERTRTANAFAHVKRNILLTDYLLNNMSRREVDAVLGHEITHLQLGHNQTRQAVYYAGLVIYIYVGVWLHSVLPSRFPLGPLFVIVSTLVLMLLSRKHEFAADRGAARLTGDPEATITALAKLSRLNTMPVHWDKVSEKLLTHPSMLHRVSAVAKACHVPPERISQLLAQSVAPPAETYPLPPSVSPKGKVFSTRFKSRSVTNSYWIGILLASALPAAIALAAHGLRLRGPQASIVYCGGFFLSLALILQISDVLPARSYRTLERKIREKLAAEPAPASLLSGLFVGLAPDAAPRFYEGKWAWDLGFLALYSDRLAYWGEEARFSLLRSQISRVVLGPGPVSWFDTPSIYITCKDATGAVKIFNLRPVGEGSATQIGKATRVLARDLQNWHTGIAAQPNPMLAVQSSAADVAALPPPSFGQVSSKLPGSATTGTAAFRGLAKALFIALCVAIVFGLHFFPKFSYADFLIARSPELRLDWSQASGWYVLLCVFLIRITQLVPYWRRRDLRLARPAPPRVPAGAPQTASTPL